MSTGNPISDQVQGAARPGAAPAGERQRLAESRRRPSEMRGLFSSAFHRFRHDWLSMAALAGLLLIVLVSVGAPWISATILRTDPETFVRCPAGLPPEQAAQCPEGRIAVLQPPGPGFWLGTDDLGRDNLTRLLYAGRVSLLVGFLVMAVAIVIGTTLGLLAGYFGGWIDDVINGIFQFVINVPSLFLLIVLSTLFKPTVLLLSVLIGLLSWPGTTRQVRSLVLSSRNRDYVDAARVMGASDARILTVHILPNVASVILVTAGLDVAGAILAESALSFLGFGVPVPLSSWGNMLSGSQESFRSAPWLVYPPGLMIFITVLCVYLVADGLRDAFDPRLRA
jgi:peptide/nickel transport system permease protein